MVGVALSVQPTATRTVMLTVVVVLWGVVVIQESLSMPLPLAQSFLSYCGAVQVRSKRVCAAGAMP